MYQGHNASRRRHSVAWNSVQNDLVPRHLHDVLAASGTRPWLRVGPRPHLLILNSYHKGYNWADEQSETILETLEKAVPNATKDVVYMDWKRHPTQTTLKDMETTLRHRYAEQVVDLIVTTDDAALIFALNHRDTLFSHAPVVYSGVFPDTTKALAANQPNVTGVYEYLDPEETIAFARELNPGYRQVYVIHDSSETSQTFEVKIRDAEAKVVPPLELHVLRNLTFGKIRQNLGILPKDSFVLLASYARDATGLVMSPENFAGHFSAASAIPVYTFYNHMVETGVVGGVVLDGQLEGQAAAKLAISILHGIPASMFAPVDRETLRPTINYAPARRFGLALDRLGPNVRIHGKPFSFIETY